jgi:excisionase family DNA binding protein
MTVWLRIADAAKRAAVSEPTIRRAIAAEKLKAYRVGPRLVRLRAEDVDAWITTGAK